MVWIKLKIQSNAENDITQGTGSTAVLKKSVRYDTIVEFNVDWKAECGQLHLAHMTRNENNKLKRTNASSNLVRHRFKIREVSNGLHWNSSKLVYHVATGSGNPVILAVNFAGPCSDVSTFCSGVTTTGGFTPASNTSNSLQRGPNYSLFFKTQYSFIKSVGWTLRIMRLIDNNQQAEKQLLKFPLQKMSPDSFRPRHLHT